MYWFQFQYNLYVLFTSINSILIIQREDLNDNKIMKTNTRSIRTSSVVPVARTVPPQYGAGDFDVAMRLYRDSSFSSPISDFPARVSLDSWLYVGISLTSTDPTLKIVLNQCYAGPGVEPDSQPQYVFVKDK